MGRSTIELKKALSTTAATALIPYDLERVLHEELLRLQPLVQLLPIAQANGKTHEYSIRSSHPQGWFEGETTPANNKTGGYTRRSVVLKIARIWGGVTGFAQAADEAFVDALATEIEGSLQGMADLLEYSALFGCANDLAPFAGDAYQTSGILPTIYNNAAATNVIDGGGSKVSLDMLDSLLSVARAHRQTQRDEGLWLCSVRMKQTIDGLQTKVQLPLQTVELADGKLVMAGYAGAPILPTSNLVPGTTSPACSAAIAAGGTLPLGDYRYRISSVTMYGECIGGTQSATVTADSTNRLANLTWTADPNAVLYMIFRQPGATGDFRLIDIIPAKTYASDGSISGNVESYSDDGSKSTIDRVNPLEADEQLIVYVNRDANRGANFLGLVDDMGRPTQNFTTFVELARVRDTYDYMIKAYFAMLIRYPNVHGVIRHVKVA